MSVIAGDFPARLTSVKLAGSTTPAVDAVAVNLPTLVFAVRSGELAVPDALVSSVACALPPAKLAPARSSARATTAAAARIRAERKRDARACDRIAGGVEHGRLKRLGVATADRRRLARRRCLCDRRGNAARGVHEREAD